MDRVLQILFLILLFCCFGLCRNTVAQYSSGDGYDTNYIDAPLPGYVGTNGIGAVVSNNYVNPAFCGWGAEVAGYFPAPGVDDEWSDTTKALGPATGNNFDIVSLGDLSQEQIGTGVPPGMITLKTSLPVCDKDGPDFAVFENAFDYFDGSIFAELGYVEVSTDGTNFTRFPSVSLTPEAVDAFDGLDVTKVYNLCGKHLNADDNSWGTPFDLSILTNAPEVISGAVCLTNINYIRVVDIPGSGDFKDSQGHPIYDPWETEGSGGLDLEAIGVVSSPFSSRIDVAVDGPGKVAPFGVPFVSVRNGSNVVFSFTADVGYHLYDVEVDGHSVGVTNRYAFSNVRSNHTLRVKFGSRLTVSSVYGAGAPAVGVSYGYGKMSATMQPYWTNGNYRYECTGWQGSGSVPTAGNGNVTGVFSLTNDSEIVWLWGATNYLLRVSTGLHGSVSTNGGWLVPGAVARITATPDPYYSFAGWSGVTAVSNNPLTVVMDAPHVITASFSTVATTNGVPIAWLVDNGLTNGTFVSEALADKDGDGQAAWQEYYAGTDPNDAASKFEIVNFGQSNGLVHVSWVAGTNGAMTPFSMQGTAEPGGAWQELERDIERAESGTNAWQGACEGCRYFRISVRTE